MTEILVAAKVEYDSKPNFDEVTDAIDVTEQDGRRAVPGATMIDIEPDLRRADDVDHADAAHADHLAAAHGHAGDGDGDGHR